MTNRYLKMLALATVTGLLPATGQAAGFAVMAGNENGAFGSALGEKKRPTINAAVADCRKKAKGKGCYSYWTTQQNHSVLWFCALPGLGTSGVDGFFGYHSSKSLADARKAGMALLGRELGKVGYSLSNVTCTEFATYSKGKFRKSR